MKNVNLILITLLLLFTACKPDAITPNGNSSQIVSTVTPATATRFSLQFPLASPNNIATPTMLLSGVLANSVVKIYTNSTCTAEVGSGLATSSSLSITTTPLVLGTYNFYTKSFSLVGVSSPCSTIFVRYQYQQAPTSLSYTSPTAIYTNGTIIPNNTPVITGGAPTIYSITPALLPAGLIFNTTTGIISGTPTAVTAASNYTVTATNIIGSTSITISLAVQIAAPAALTYSAPTAVYTLGTVITNNTQTTTGGAPTLYAILPALPAGLIFSTTTGTISGTPTAIPVANIYTVTASNSTGSTSAIISINVRDTIPTNLTYSAATATYISGTVITNNTPSNTGGTPTVYAISPALPTGLIFNTATGIISGTPSVTSASSNYNVMASNSTGSAMATLTLTVQPAAPTALTYSAPLVTYTNGIAITNNTPSNSGGAPTSYAIVPSLTAATGLNFNTSTGVISGTPANIRAASPYTVTATNITGSTSVALSIAVQIAAPSNLTYSVNPAFYTNGSVIINNTPTSLGGAPTSYFLPLLPALPLGLSFNTATGIISGTPLEVFPSTDYRITASNGNGTGSTSVVFTLSVQPAAPTGLTYSASPVIYTKGTLITNNTPTTSGGGAVTGYSISPPLPAGLLFDPVTGIISGTPSAISASAPYTITASNRAGGTTATFAITVQDTAPTALIYSANPATYVNGNIMTNNTPSNSGGLPTSYSISPAQPNGLNFSTTTGVLSGIPNGVTGTKDYTISAINSAGSTSVIVPIRIAASGIAPSGLSYSATPVTYTMGTPITNNLPSYLGGVPTSYSPSSMLPTGLIFDSATGIISGTPTAITGTAIYTVTASNSSGSTTAPVSITVQDRAPTALSYSQTTGLYTNGIAITNNTLVFSGGTPTLYASSAPLPAGLILNTSTGIISGTPTVSLAKTFFTITASNPAGSAATVISIEILNSTVVPITATSMTRQIPSTSPSNNATPSFTLNGLVVNTRAKIYTDGVCTNEVGSAVANSSSTVVTITLPAIGNYNLYTRSFNISGVGSTCSGLMLTYTLGHLIDATFTYDFVPTTGKVVDYNNTVQKPVRQVYVVMKRSADNSIISTFNTDDLGNIKYYSTINDTVYFEINAEIKSPSVIIQDNTLGYAKYVVGTGPTVVNADVVINQNLPSGWSGLNNFGSYTATRVAAPFAILDSIYSAIKLIKTARPAVNFPNLTVAWSVNNVGSNGAVPENLTAGEIVNTHYRAAESRIYVRGKDGVNTDEYDRFIIVREWGHYFENKLSRSDMISGAHAQGDIKDIATAWSEGWTNALAAIVFYPDVTYVDTFGVKQQSGSGFDIVAGPDTSPGWYSEASIQKIFFQLNGALGIGALYDVLVGAQKTTTAITSIFSFIDGLKTANPLVSANIDAVVTPFGIASVADKYGSTETNTGGFATLPLYTAITPGGPSATLNLFGYSADSLSDLNGAYNTKYLTFVATGATFINLASTDSFQLYIYKNNVQTGALYFTRAASTVFGPFMGLNLNTLAGENIILKIRIDKQALFYKTINTPVNLNIGIY